MWHLNQQWEQNRATLARLEKQQAEGMNISEARLAEAREQVARDLLHQQTIAAAQAARTQAIADDAAQRQAQRDQQAKDEEARYLASARQRYTGTAEQWEADKGEIARQWRIRQALGDAESSMEMAASRVRL